MTKPKSPRQWNSTIPARRRRIAQHGKPRARNPKRAASAFAFAYHSRARKAFVKALGCVFCTGISPFFGLATAGRSDNAHTGKKPGKGLKSHYTTIVPLCRTHHRMYDDREKALGLPAVREAIESTAAEVERRWQAHVARVSGDTGGTPE